MDHKFAKSFIAASLAVTLALAPPALARGGGGGGGGGGHGGGGFGGGGHGGFGGGMHGGMGVGGMGGGAHFGGVGPGPGFGTRFAGGPHFGGAPFAHGVHGPRFSHFAGHRHFFHRRFAFAGGPYYYSDYGYDGCWRQVWTAYGPRWADVCGEYGAY